MTAARLCSVPGCGRNRHGVHLCRKHLSKRNARNADNPTPLPWPDDVQDVDVPIYCDSPRQRTRVYEADYYARAASVGVLCDGRAR